MDQRKMKKNGYIQGELCLAQKLHSSEQSYRTTVSAPEGTNEEHFDSHLDGFLKSSYPQKYKAVTSTANYP